MLATVDTQYLYENYVVLVLGVAGLDFFVVGLLS